MRPPVVTGVFVIAAKDLQQRLLDHSLLMYGIAAPLVLAFIFSLLLSPLASGGGPVPNLVLVDRDAGVLSSGLRRALAGAQAGGAFEVHEAREVSEARRQIDTGESDVALVVPDGFGADVTGGGAGRLNVMGSVDQPLASHVATAVAEAYLSRVRSTALSVRAMAEEGAADTALPAIARQASAPPEPLTLQVMETSARQLDLVTHYAAGMAVFFVFFTVQIGVTGLLDEERDGTLPRLFVAPIPRGAILGGKILASTILGLMSMAVLAAASALLMGAAWGDPLGVAVLILGVVLAAAGIMAVVAGLAGSSESASNIQSMVAVTLGALGGTFFPVAAGEGALDLLSRLTPHFWFLQGVADLSSGGGLPSVAEEMFGILLFALLTGTAGWWILQTRLKP